MIKKVLIIFMGGLLYLFGAGIIFSSEMPKEKQELSKWINSNKDYLYDISDTIWKYAEPAMLEYKSSRLMKRELEKAGFTITHNAADMPTAFVAEYGSGKPIIGILAEYDALPGLSQKLSTVKGVLAPGTAGHGCGHNLLGTAAFGGALAVKDYMKKHNIAGTIRLYGCPAEETLVGKVFMVRAGLFDDLDAVVDWHPGGSTGASCNSSLAMNSFKVRFFGKTAHGSADPWNGRSALDAVELMNAGVNMMREHVNPTVRIHYVITDGGNVPNVVPGEAEAWYFARDVKRESVVKLYGRILKIAESAAAATETEYEVRLITGCYELLPNKTGTVMIQKNLEIIGPPRFIEEDHEFARALQKAMDVEEKGMSTEIEKLDTSRVGLMGGSTDVADVSWTAPLARFGVATIAPGVRAHSWAVVACSGGEVGHKGMIVAAKTFAFSVYDLLTDGVLLKKMKREWKENTKDVTYKSPVPDEIKPPVLPEPK
ncbi:amidohydrolase [bacterium]|nr:amidohydrolase [bacterium]